MRVCKGAYAEDEAIAWHDRMAINGSFVDLVTAWDLHRQLIDKGLPYAGLGAVRHGVVPVPRRRLAELPANVLS